MYIESIIGYNVTIGSIELYHFDENEEECSSIFDYTIDFDMAIELVEKGYTGFYIEEDNITHFVDIELEQFAEEDIEKLKEFVEKNKDFMI